MATNLALSWNRKPTIALKDKTYFVRDWTLADINILKFFFVPISQLDARLSSYHLILPTETSQIIL